MKRFILCGLALFVLAVAPAISSAACISTQAGDWDDCSERRRPGREPASWCGGGGGSSPSGWRQQREQDIADAIAKLKASFSSLVLFGQSPDID